MAKIFPVIDLAATGENITRLRKNRGLTVRDLQNWFGFDEPQAIYKWQKGKSLPTVDNLYALGALLEVPMDAILVQAKPVLTVLGSTHPNTNIKNTPQAEACGIAFFWDPNACGAAESRGRSDQFSHLGRGLREVRRSESLPGCPDGMEPKGWPPGPAEGRDLRFAHA